MIKWSEMILTTGFALRFRWRTSSTWHQSTWMGKLNTHGKNNSCCPRLHGSCGRGYWRWSSLDLPGCLFLFDLRAGGFGRGPWGVSWHVSIPAKFFPTPSIYPNRAVPLRLFTGLCDDTKLTGSAQYLPTSSTNFKTLCQTPDVTAELAGNFALIFLAMENFGTEVAL